VIESRAPHVVLIGCGRWGRLILRDLSALGARVTVVIPHGDQRASTFPEAIRVVPSLSDAETADGIVIATPTSTHGDILLNCLEHDIPIYCEKPLTDSVELAQRVVDQALDRVFVMDKWRYHPAVEAMRDIVSARTFGTVLGLDTVRTQWGNPHADVDCAWILLPHDLSIALEVLGEIPRVTSSTAITRRDRLVQLSSSWQFTNGTSMTTVVGEDSSVSVRQIRLHCEQAVVTLDGGWSDHLEVMPLDGPPDAPPRHLFTPGPQPLLAELSAFVNHLLGGPPPKSTAREGLANVIAVADARSMAAVT